MRNCIILCMVALLLSACASKSPVQPVTKDALYYFQQGEMAFEEEEYTKAIEHWQRVRDSFTSPELTALSELKIADAQLADELYIEAIASYEDFLKQHPASVRKSDILFRLGKAHFSQILVADRDQTATRNALATFEQLQKNFPSKVNPQELDNLILQCRSRLAENEIYVGHFYLKTKRYKAAISRFEKLRTDYPEFYDMGHVQFYLAQAYYHKGDTETAITLFDDVTRYNDEKLNKESTKLRRKFNI
ncbi:MAG: outer membrane protein assembly factor BamD [Deltaproteobacteria bacterium]|nr:outer membrane protein assembly factor BamD [Deltaproteobacteria bacterium]